MTILIDGSIRPAAEMGVPVKGKAIAVLLAIFCAPAFLQARQVTRAQAAGPVYMLQAPGCGIMIDTMDQTSAHRMRKLAR